MGLQVPFPKGGLKNGCGYYYNSSRSNKQFIAPYGRIKQQPLNNCF